MIVRALLQDDGGQGLAEYALILGFIAVLCVAAVGSLGGGLAAQFQSASTVYP